MIEDRNDRLKAFWVEVRSCQACDPQGFIEVVGVAGNDEVSRCMNHDWESNTPGQGRIENMANTPPPRRPDDESAYPPEWGSTERLTAYWFAMRNELRPKSVSDWKSILRRCDREREQRHLRLNPVVDVHLPGDDDPPF
jgi:hypothetical protein